LYIIAISA